MLSCFSVVQASSALLMSDLIYHYINASHLLCGLNAQLALEIEIASKVQNKSLFSC
jgi:hypothetical protein